MFRVSPASRARPSSALLGALSLGGLLGLGCATEVPDYTVDSESGSRHAVINVEWSEEVGTDEPATADAFAQFVKVPPTEDPARVLRAVGVARDVPAAGECRAAAEFDAISGPLGSIGRVELLDVGQVTLEAAGTQTSLGVHAFPTVSDFASGVVYATRDRDAAVLPADARYEFRVAGSSSAPTMAFAAQAPELLWDVTVAGIPLAEVAALPAAEPMDLTWDVGSAGDVVYAEVVTQDEATAVVCTFRDEDGVGTIPAEATAAPGTVRLSLHRLRVRDLSDPSVDTSVARFDFEVTTFLDLE